VSVTRQQSFIESHVQPDFFACKCTCNCNVTTGDEVNNNGDGMTGYDNDDDGDGRRRRQHRQLQDGGALRGGGSVNICDATTSCHKQRGEVKDGRVRRLCDKR